MSYSFCSSIYMSLQNSTLFCQKLNYFIHHTIFTLKNRLIGVLSSFLDDSYFSHTIFFKPMNEFHINKFYSEGILIRSFSKASIIFFLSSRSHSHCLPFSVCPTTRRTIVEVSKLSTPIACGPSLNLLSVCISLQICSNRAMAWSTFS